MKSLSIRQGDNRVKEKGVHIRKTGYGSEHQVYLKGQKPNSGVGYFSDDLEDARQTGHKMAQEHEQAHWGNGKGTPTA